MREDGLTPPGAIFFKSPEEFSDWLRRHHDQAEQLWVGFHKRATGQPSMTWAQSVDEALCWGWIDGVRRSLDDKRYTIRFTPRKKSSTWSLTNIRRVEALREAGRLQPAGEKAFEARSETRSGVYAYEQKTPSLSAPYTRQFKAHPSAWEFFTGQAPWYQRNATYWVMNAKQETTRQKRLETLIEDSGAGRILRRSTRTPPVRKS